MIITNSFSNFISNLNNALAIQKMVVIQPKSKKILNFLDLLLEENFIRSYKLQKNSKYIIIFLFKKEQMSFHQLIQISKKKKPIFQKNKDLFHLDNNCILSTTHGFLTKKKALQLKIGGKVIIKLCTN